MPTTLNYNPPPLNPAPSNPMSMGPVAYGTQQNPLSKFSNAQGLTGNKTTNKDLPQWLKDIGMKGDAYAGGMLKPELRYGFAYKGGKIHFADGTSFDATKNKGGTYSYTDASGKPVTYSPTDEQNEYNKNYKASTSNQSFLDKATNAVNFELWHGKQILQGIGSNPKQLLFGIDPIGTKIGNTVFGDDAKPLVDQLGGANADRYDQYGRPTGYAKPLQGAAHVVAGVMGGNAVGGIGAGGGTLPAGTTNLATQGAGALGGAITKYGVSQGVKTATSPDSNLPGQSQQSPYTPNTGSAGPTVRIGGGGNYVNNPYATSAPMAMGQGKIMGSSPTPQSSPKPMPMPMKNPMITGSSPKTPPAMQPQQPPQGGGGFAGGGFSVAPNDGWGMVQRPAQQNPMIDPRNRLPTPGQRGIMPVTGANPTSMSAQSPISQQMAQANALRMMGMR